MDFKRTFAAKPQRWGFTVIELLVVMGIIVLVAAVTLPAIKGLLSGQKVTEAARLVQGYAEAAKNRAVATGRPVALILDRTRYDGSGGLSANNMCTRLSMGDVFPPYTGDWAGAKGFTQDYASPPNGNADGIRIPLAQAASLYDTVAGASTGMVQAGDRIELGERRESFYISAEPTLYVDGSNQFVQIEFNNPSLTTGGVAMQEAAAEAPVGRSKLVSFRIYRKPSKSLAGGISLPRGTCIDMHFSGFGQSGMDLSTDAIQPTSGSSKPYYPPTFPAPNSNHNPNFGPVYLVFSPDGHVNNWYRQNRANSIASPELQRGYPSGLVHLLVGETDQVPGSPYVDPAAAAIDTEDYQTNIMDSGNLWVTINPYTGSVSTSELQPHPPSGTAISDGASLNERIKQARSLATNYLPAQTQ